MKPLRAMWMSNPTDVSQLRSATTVVGRYGISLGIYSVGKRSLVQTLLRSREL